MRMGTSYLGEDGREVVCFAGEKYDNDLKGFLDDASEPVFFYIVRNHVSLDEYDPYWGSGLTEFVVSEHKLTDGDIDAVIREQHPELYDAKDEDDADEVDEVATEAALAKQREVNAKPASEREALLKPLRAAHGEPKGTPGRLERIRAADSALKEFDNAVDILGVARL
jgi:hypothetical protein